MQLFEYPSIRKWVKEINETLGAEKINFLIRETDDATMAGAPVESCRFVVLRSPGGAQGRYKRHIFAIAYAACAGASRLTSARVRSSGSSESF